MATTHAQRDPRSIVTPDAFEVSEALLGLQLAPPGKRFVALLIDLAVIGLLTLVTRSFALVLGVVAAIFFMRAGFKRTPVKGSVFGRAMRLSVGCLGIFIAMVTAIVWSALGVDFGLRRDEPSAAVAEADRGGALGTVARALRAVGPFQAFVTAETLAEAEDAAADLIDDSQDFGVSRGDLRRLLDEMVPQDAPWAGDAAGMLDRVFAAADVDQPGEAAEDRSSEVAGYTEEEALAAYAAALAGDPDDAGNAALRDALGARLVGTLAADTLAALGERIDDLQRANRNQQEALEEVADQLDEQRSGGLFNWLRTAVDELGFGFGWASLYMTILLSWWKGQTVGKRMMGLRVLRLDGEPITWWTAFERAGGYAAGFATGLLGFAQVYWDANRQCIHDRIVGTVVVLDKADRITDWESAL